MAYMLQAAASPPPFLPRLPSPERIDESGLICCDDGTCFTLTFRALNRLLRSARSAP